MFPLGIVFTRHVCSEKTNLLWLECYAKIRTYYPTNLILIIDDNSNSQYEYNITSMTNVYIVQSEYAGAGELLAYYYMHKLRLFETAIVIHDSLFLGSKIDVSFTTTTVRFLWHFQHYYDNSVEEKALLERLENSKELIEFYDTQQWWGCFGVQSIITLDFLDKLVKKYNLFQMWLPHIHERNQRYHIERVFGILCCREDENLYLNPSLFGDIHRWTIPWGFSMEQYLQMQEKEKQYLPVIKVWAER